MISIQKLCVCCRSLLTHVFFFFCVCVCRFFCVFLFVCKDVCMCTRMHTCRYKGLPFPTLFVEVRSRYWNPELISSTNVSWGPLITAFPVLGLKVSHHALLVFMWMLEIWILETLYSLSHLSGPSTSSFGSDSNYWKNSCFLFSCLIVSHGDSLSVFSHNSYLYCFQFGAIIWTKLLQHFCTTNFINSSFLSPE